MGKGDDLPCQELAQRVEEVIQSAEDRLEDLENKALMKQSKKYLFFLKQSQEAGVEYLVGTVSEPGHDAA